MSTISAQFFPQTTAWWNREPATKHPVGKIIVKICYCALAAIMAVVETVKAAFRVVVSLALATAFALDPHADGRPPGATLRQPR